MIPIAIFFITKNYTALTILSQPEAFLPANNNLNHQSGFILYSHQDEIVQKTLIRLLVAIKTVKYVELKNIK